jgi:DNA-binding NarL/FixJ family response regulator
MPDGPSPLPSLRGASLIAAVFDPTHALAVGTMLARAGADVTVARCAQAVREALAVRPGGFDGALVDLGLGDEHDTITELLRRHSAPCFHALVGDKDQLGDAREAFGSGAIDIVLAPLRAEELVHAIARVVEATASVRRRCGVATPAHTVPRRRPRALQPGPELEHAIAGIARDRLSPRELNVLRYIALGYRYQEIGRELSISLSTVKMHASNVRRKIGAGTRWDLLRMMFAA